MVFDIKGKVALITGGASGVGFEYAKALLKNGLKGVTLADINEDQGKKAVEIITSTFGPNKAIFVKTDVTNIKQFEDAFIQTVRTFGNIDILFNNAGILNDSIWEKQISINVNGVINGILLAMEKYLPKYQTGPDALIVNISSIAGLIGSGHVPVYCATKHAIIGLTRSWGESHFYNKLKTRVVAICPGVTDTPLISEIKGRSLGNLYEQIGEEFLDVLSVQKPTILAEEAMNVVKYAPNGTVWVIEGGEPAYEYVYAERDEMKHNSIKKYKF